MDQSQQFTQQDIPQNPIQDPTPSTVSTAPVQVQQTGLPLRVVGIIFIIILVGAGGFFLGGRMRNVQQAEQSTSTTSSAISIGSPVPARPKQTLHESLKQYCIPVSEQQPGLVPGKISTKYLPFALNRSFKSSYLAQDPEFFPSASSYLTQDPEFFPCVIPKDDGAGGYNGGYIALHGRTERLERKIELYITDKDSGMMGMENVQSSRKDSFYDFVSEKPAITINDHEIFLALRPSSPYAFVSTDPGIYLWAEKTDTSLGTQVNMRVWPSSEGFKNIIEKYREKTPLWIEKSGEPVYTIDTNNMEPFRQELLKIAPTLPEIQELAREMSADLDRIQF